MLIRWVVMVAAVIVAGWATSALGFKFSVDVSSTRAVLELFVGVAILAFVNATLGNILKFLTLPLSCLTLGLFAFVINAAMLFLVGQWSIGFTIGDFWSALVGAILISIANSILSNLLGIKDDKSDSDD